MSMYNAMFGMNPNAGVVLGMLGLDPADFGRFRDAWIDEGPTLVVYTRCGGGNREDYASVFERMQSHPCYLSDADDDYDCTYASFRFSCPTEFEDEARKLIASPASLQDRTSAAIEDMKNMTPEQIRTKFPAICNALDQIAGKTIE